jgi:hypothetical protein
MSTLKLKAPHGWEAEAAGITGGWSEGGSILLRTPPK